MSVPHSPSDGEQPVSPYSGDKSPASTTPFNFAQSPSEGEQPESRYSREKSPEPDSPFDYAPEVDKSAQAPELDQSGLVGQLHTIQYGDEIEVLPRRHDHNATGKPIKRRPYFKIALIVAIILIIVVIALSVGLTIGLRRPSDQSNPAQTTTPSSTSLPAGPTSTPSSAPTKNGVMKDTSIAGLSSPDTDYLFYQDVSGSLRVGTYSQSQNIFNFEVEPIRTAKPPRNNTPLAMVSLTNPDTQDNLQFLSYVNSDNMLAIFGFNGRGDNLTAGQDFLMGDFPVAAEGRRISASPRVGINNNSTLSLYVFYEAPNKSITALSGILNVNNFTSSWQDVSAAFFSNAPNVSTSTPFDIVYSFDNTTATPVPDIGLHGAFFNPASISDPKAPLYTNVYLNGSADENLPKLNFTYTSQAQASSSFPASNLTAASLRDTDWLLFSFEPDGSDNRVAVVVDQKMQFLGWNIPPPITVMPYGRMIFTNEANGEYTIYNQLNESVLMAHTLVNDVGWTTFNITVPFS